jgi:predicted NBD/HSP70 family sugar kinase
MAVDEMLAAVGLYVADLAAIGLATPGTMDIPRGIFLQPHNLPHWHYFPIRDCVAEAFGKPTAFANDANAAAYGEFWVGSGQKFHSIIMLTLGTGVGGGIIIGDLSVDGENSHGSECGHSLARCITATLISGSAEFTATSPILKLSWVLPSRSGSFDPGTVGEATRSFDSTSWRMW